MLEITLDVQFYATHGLESDIFNITKLLREWVQGYIESRKIPISNVFIPLNHPGFALCVTKDGISKVDERNWQTHSKIQD